MNKIQKTVLHPTGDKSVDLYPATSADQVLDLVEFLNKQGLNPRPFVVGRVETLPAGDNASVTFTEYNDKIAINFYIPMGARGVQGNIGETGREGPVGPRGPAGNDFQIKLQVASVEDLPTASSAYLGWAAYVGTATPRDVWACVEIADGVIAWENQGKLQGAKGDTGNGVISFNLLAHTTVGNETVNTIQASYTETNANTFEIHAVNGANGKDGLDGLDGRDGTKWITGSGSPTTTSGYNIGDFYLDTVSGSFYQLNGVYEWELKGNLRGPSGASGIGHLYRHDFYFSADNEYECFITFYLNTLTSLNDGVNDFRRRLTSSDMVCSGYVYSLDANITGAYMLNGRLYLTIFRQGINSSYEVLTIDDFNDVVTTVV